MYHFLQIMDFFFMQHLFFSSSTVKTQQQLSKRNLLYESSTFHCIMTAFTQISDVRENSK